MPRKVRAFLHRLRKRPFLSRCSGDESRKNLLCDDGTKQLSLEALYVPKIEEEGFDFSSCSLTASISDVYSDDSDHSSEEEAPVARQDISGNDEMNMIRLPQGILSSRKQMSRKEFEFRKGYQLPRSLADEDDDNVDEGYVRKNVVASNTSDTDNNCGCDNISSFFDATFELHSTSLFPERTQADDELSTSPTRPFSVVERVAECYDDGSVNIIDDSPTMLHADNTNSAEEAILTFDQNSNAPQKRPEVIVEDVNRRECRHYTIENMTQLEISIDDRVTTFNGCIHIFHDNLPTLREEPSDLEMKASEECDEISSLNDVIYESSEDEDNIRTRWEHSVKMMSYTEPDYLSVVEAVSSGSIVGIGTVEIAEI